MPTSISKLALTLAIRRSFSSRSSQRRNSSTPATACKTPPAAGIFPTMILVAPPVVRKSLIGLGRIPPGFMESGHNSVSGATTSYTFNIYEYGQPVEMFYFDANGDFVKSIQMTSTLSSGQFGSTIAAIPDQSFFDGLVPDDPAGNPNPGINPSSFAPLVRGVSTGTKVPSQFVAVAGASKRPVK